MAGVRMNQNDLVHQEFVQLRQQHQQTQNEVARLQQSCTRLQAEKEQLQHNFQGANTQISHLQTDLQRQIEVSRVAEKRADEATKNLVQLQVRIKLSVLGSYR